jgi:hypothetical protein
VSGFLSREREDNKTIALDADYIQYLDRRLRSEAVPAYRRTSATGVEQ